MSEPSDYEDNNKGADGDMSSSVGRNTLSATEDETSVCSPEKSTSSPEKESSAVGSDAKKDILLEEFPAQSSAHQTLDDNPSVSNSSSFENMDPSLLDNDITRNCSKEIAEIERKNISHVSQSGDRICPLDLDITVEPSMAIQPEMGPGLPQNLDCSLRDNTAPISSFINKDVPIPDYSLPSSSSPAPTRLIHGMLSGYVSPAMPRASSDENKIFTLRSMLDDIPFNNSSGAIPGFQTDAIEEPFSEEYLSAFGIKTQDEVACQLSALECFEKEIKSKSTNVAEIILDEGRQTLKRPSNTIENLSEFPSPSKQPKKSNDKSSSIHSLKRPAPSKYQSIESKRKPTSIQKASITGKNPSVKSCINPTSKSGVSKLQSKETTVTPTKYRSFDASNMEGIASRLVESELIKAERIRLENSECKKISTSKCGTDISYVIIEAQNPISRTNNLIDLFRRMLYICNWLWITPNIPHFDGRYQFDRDDYTYENSVMEEAQESFISALRILNKEIGESSSAPQAAGGSSSAPQAAGGSSSAPQAAGGKSSAPQAAGGKSSAPQPTGGKSRAPRPTGGKSRAPQPTGNKSRAPQSTGVSSRAPQSAGVSSRAPQTTDGSSRATQTTGRSSRTPQRAACRTLMDAIYNLPSYLETMAEASSDLEHDDHDLLHTDERLTLERLRKILPILWLRVQRTATKVAELAASCLKYCVEGNPKSKRLDIDCKLKSAQLMIEHLKKVVGNTFHRWRNHNMSHAYISKLAFIDTVSRALDTVCLSLSNEINPTSCLRPDN